MPAVIANLSTQLEVLALDHNYISGSIPPGIENLVGLEALALSSNYLTGIIPQSIGKLSRLQKLYLDINNLTGPIPSSLGNLTQLNSLIVAFNNLQGPIPTTVRNLQQLTLLDLSHNKLSSSIPKETFVLSSLSQYLSLSYNSLVGSLPSEVGGLTNLRSLEVSGNRLSGEIPDTLGNCQVMEYLLMDDNNFHGNIPQTMGNMRGLQVLNLTQNNLSGLIPDALGSIYGLQELHLSHNNFSGHIPKILQNLTNLLELDLSFNHLEGEVPKEGVFKNVSALSILGNAGLCGGMLQLHLPACPAPIRTPRKKRLQRYVRIVIPITGATLFFILSLLAALLFYRKFKLRKKDASLTQATEDQYPKVSYGELFKATDGFSQTHLIGKGRYGSVYKGTLSYNQSTIVAIKVFNLQQSGSSKSFIAECEALRRVRHRSLIKIISCCSSIDYQGNDFKALIFEFMPNNSLESWLHPKADDSQQCKTLSLPERLNILVDVADALDYLHHSCQPAIVHCDMKPSNILLDQEKNAHVGDFGLARLLPEVVSTSLVDSRSSIGIRGSIGYVAPEYGEASQLSTSGDVYSFGITVLEMFTGRSPVDEIFKDGLNLHEYAAGAFPERIMEIVDPIILLHAEDNVAAIDSRRGGNTSRRIVETCLVSVIKLALLCSKQSPRARMSMRDAAKEMHTIRDAYLGVRESQNKAYSAVKECLFLC
uniref:Receptor kinase-like protein Xa21 n=1 Tax=Ananas comosus var. bracteatus TaxID=296719 RepID=A0A6V7QDZ9_ANACO|nr:unnamed protein product [Ananas comosus var. bracteatus]